MKKKTAVIEEKKLSYQEEKTLKVQTTHELIEKNKNLIDVAKFMSNEEVEKKDTASKNKKTITQEVVDMETKVIEAAYKQFIERNRHYIEVNQLQDAVQDSFVYFLERNNRGKLNEINQSFIHRGVKYAKLNQLRNANANVLGFDDIVNTEDDFKVEDIIGELDMKLQNVDVEIEVEQHIEEMVKHDKRIADIMSFYKKGWNGKQLAEMFGMSETTISRILNFQIKHDHKAKRKKIDRSKLKEFQKAAKKYGSSKKTYIRVGDIALMNDGRIFSKKNYFNGTKSGNEFLSYIDTITIEQFIEVASEMRNH